MEKRNWQMTENFVFPVSAGIPVGAETFKVTPGYTEERTEDAVRLTGIYHIAINVNFDEGERAEEALDSAVLIDDVDLRGNTGYFEYAIPLNIDLPPEASSPLNVETANVTVDSDGQGSLEIVWDVNCSYQNAGSEDEIVEKVVEQVIPEPVTESVTAQVEEPIQEPVVKQLPETVSKPAPQPSTESVLASVPEQTVETVPIEVGNAVSIDQNDPLSFVAGLDDGISTKVFRLNDVFVESNS